MQKYQYLKQDEHEFFFEKSRRVGSNGPLL